MVDQERGLFSEGALCGEDWGSRFSEGLSRRIELYLGPMGVKKQRQR